MKKAIILILALTLAAALTGCAITDQGQIISGNRIVDGLDVQYFDYAYVMLGDRVIAEGKVEQWRDYSNSDVVQVVIDGQYYLTHYTNVVMVASVQNRLGGSWDVETK